VATELYRPNLFAPAGAQLTYRGGPLLKSVKLFGVFFDDFDMKTEMSAYLDWLAKSDVLAELKEYGTGLGSHIGDAHLSLDGSTPPPPPPVCPPGCVPCTPASMPVRRSSVIISLLRDKAAATTVDDSQLQDILTQAISAGSLPKPDSETLFVLFPPDGVTVTLSQDASCQTFCGYHDYFMLPDGVTVVYYAVLPFPSCQGCLGPYTQEESLTSITSHEVCEAITDAIPGSGWYDDANGEIGDICAWQTRQDGPYVVQLEWSNAANSCI